MDSMKAPAEGNRTIGRRVLREHIMERLMDDILTGKLQPGARIVETHVSKEFGVSQAPVREALRDLERLGFVVSSAFRGTRVRRISRDELLEIYPIRAALEGIAARAAAVRMDESALARLDELLAEMREAALRGDDHAQVKADIAFHRTIMETSGNKLLMQFWEEMRLATTTFLTTTNAHRPLTELAERHGPLLAALRGRDPESAERAMRDHIEGAGEWMLSELQQDGETEPAAPDANL